MRELQAMEDDVWSCQKKKQKLRIQIDEADEAELVAETTYWDLESPGFFDLFQCLDLGDSNHSLLFSIQLFL